MQQLNLNDDYDDDRNGIKIESGNKAFTVHIDKMCAIVAFPSHTQP
jgi:hypothetical protein